jgi:hypothetical protein
MVVWKIPWEGLRGTVTRGFRGNVCGKMDADSGVAGRLAGCGFECGPGRVRQKFISPAKVRRESRAAFGLSWESKLVEAKPAHVEIRLVAIRRNAI